MNNFEQAYQKIIEAKNIFLVTHFDPDGDAIASLCLFIEILKQLKKDYYPYCYNEPPQNLLFLPNAKKINFTLSQSKEKKNPKPNLKNFDLIITLDCGSLDRTRLGKEIKNRDKNQILIEFDHHIKTENFADIEIRHSKAAATVEVVYDFIQTNNIKLNKKMAVCILTGLITDTGNFLYPSTSHKTIQIASQMLRFGVNINKIIKKALQNKDLQGLKLWGEIINNMQINPKYNLAIAVLPREKIKQYRAQEDTLEGIASLLGTIKGIRAALFLRQEQLGLVKGSLRTNTDFNVARLAQILGGGGHKKAAGFSIKGDLVKKGENWQIV